MHGSLRPEVDRDFLTRRRFLGLLGVGGTVALAGCVAPAQSASSSAPAASAPAASAPLGSAPTPAPTPAQLTSVRYSITSRTAGNWQDYVAVRKGFFAEHGIEPEMIVTGTTVVSVQSLASGSTDVSYITADSAIAAVEKGADIVAVWGGQNLPVYSLIVQPQISSYEGLRGTAIGVSALSSGDAFFVQRMMERAGLRLPDDYDMIPAGGTPERYAALKNGAIAGALLVQPFDTRIVKDGFRRLALSTEAVRYYSWNALWVQRAWARANEETLLRVLRAMRQAHEWLYDPKNREEAIEILVAELQAEPDEARDAYELLVQQGAYSRQGEIPEEAMQTPIDFLAGRGEIAQPLPLPSKYIDMSYQRKVVG
jgi:ABC-type nitrate/sulfonate/bicarbonate transport system substrate-binding protein